MNFSEINKLLCLVLTIFCFTNVYSQNSIKFSTQGQQYGVADLDHFWISATKDQNNCCFEKRMEHPDAYTVGHEAGRVNAKDGFVWDQFGCGSTDPYPSKSGYVRYDNVTCEGKQYIKIRYSKYSPSTTTIEILINDTKQAEFLPVDQGSWENFTETDWIELSFPPGTIKPPDGVSATDGIYTDKVRVTWNTSTGASHYRVYRNTSSSTSAATALGNWQTSTTYDDNSATPGQTYYYWVKAATSNTGSKASDFSLYDTGYPKKSQSSNSIKFVTQGQQYGVADLDHFWISATKDTNNCCCERRMEDPDSFTVGHKAGRTNAKDGFVWDQFGCGSTDPYPSKSGYVRYDNVTCEGKQYIKIRYSKYSPSTSKIEIFINDSKQAEFLPVDQGSWENFTETDWIEINFTPTPVTISGYVKTSEGLGVNGVTLSFSNSGGTTTTNSSGYYSQNVNYSWSGTATPNKTGYTFDPSSRTYSNITSNISNQNYTAIDVPSLKSIKFFTQGQQYGVADLDHFWISATKDKNNCSFEKRMEHPDAYTVGHEAGRANALNGFVWDQFGCGSTDPYPSKSGYVRYDNVTCEGKQYIKIRYSKYSASTVPIEILINDTKKAEFIPMDQGSWENFTETEWIGIDCSTAVFITKNSQIINSYILYDNYPNPFNSSTTFRFYLPFSNEINLSIYNINGNVVKKIIDTNFPKGEYHVIWDGTDNYGSHVSSGMYICRLSADNVTLQKKLLFIK